MVDPIFRNTPSRPESHKTSIRRSVIQLKEPKQALDDAAANIPKALGW